MSSFDKIKLLSSKVADSIFKGEKIEELEKSKDLTDDEKNYVLSNILDKNKKQERFEFTSKLNKQRAWENFMESTKQKTKTKPKVKPMYRYYAAAASIAVLLGITFFLNDNIGSLQSNETIIVDNNIETGTDKATLILEDGSKVALEKGTTYQTSNANSNGEEIVYSTKAKAIKDMMYNTLAIPRGGQFHIQLSDGTKVWLNSESQLKYPVAFVKGETRQVELVYGEAYFDVSPSTEHNGAKFKVFHKEQEIEVLGTEFNIKAYKDEAHIYTTLIEGSVAVNTQYSNKTLVPGEQSVLNTQNNTIAISEVDTYNEISWKDGIFRFQGKRLEDLMKVLARWYDMEVIFEKEAHKNIKFKGVLKKSQSIEEVMSIIESTSINNYAINNKTITIK
ncbi:FecR family protein [Flavivirga rizhaonensis]|uniref:FecR family protein n=1 Tax=Flavivirga rizhaonensis TaxID=2559571 RepID=A0A4V3P516_9FLAO|nr:FecR family protein [Flavivirga rizhaonensis]TGV03614.1 FecR family protein [Flavivirga rizhaonensis]